MIATMIGNAHAETLREEFTVSVQFRGSIRKNFEDIGRGNLIFKQIDPVTFQVLGYSRVQHPRETETFFEVDLDMTYRIEGDRLILVEDLSESNLSGKPLLRRISRIAPFVYLAKQIPFPREDEPATHTLSTSRGAVEMRWRRIHRTVELTVSESTGLVGKFFLPRFQNTRPYEMKKFRIPGKDHLMISFVSD